MWGGGGSRAVGALRLFLPHASLQCRRPGRIARRCIGRAADRPPEAGNLAVRRLGTLCFAPYRSWAAARPELLDWVALDGSDARHPAAHWVHRQGHPIHALAASVATLHNLIRAGAGIGVMPCMIGDSDPALTRAGPVIAELIPRRNECDSLRQVRPPPRLPTQPPILTLWIGQDWWLGREVGREADNGHSP
jgi:DNA-binding transcriptional LysR family regulator